jgi:hypothetical protein
MKDIMNHFLKINFILLLMFIHVVKNIDLEISTLAKLTDCLVQEG